MTDEGFRNSILGGVGQLVRTFIQSPNYSPGAAGWTINKDGSAEFNNATFRGTVVIQSATQALLVYDGTPALGKLILSIASVAGVDSFGNHFQRGLGLYNASGIGTSQITITNFDNVIDGALYLDAFENMFLEAKIASLFLKSSGVNGSVLMVSPSNRFTVDTGFRFGLNALAGAYYYEQVNMPAQSIPAAAFTTVSGLIASKLRSDYGSQFNLPSGTWTAPVQGEYLFTVACSMAGVGTFRQAITATKTPASVNNRFLSLDVNAAGASGGQSVSAVKEMNAGDSVLFQVFQGSAAAQLINTGDERSYISIMRLL